MWLVPIASRGQPHPFKDWVAIPAAHADAWLHYAETALDSLNG